MNHDTRLLGKVIEGIAQLQNDIAFSLVSRVAEDYPSKVGEWRGLEQAKTIIEQALKDDR